jgi:hypothetical protein
MKIIQNVIQKTNTNKAIENVMKCSNFEFKFF